VAIAAGVYALISGTVSFLGWALDIPRLTDWNNSGISIQPNTTVAVICSGLALILLALPTRGHARHAPAALGMVVAFIGASTLFQYFTGITLEHLNTALMFGRQWGRVGVIHPGRMGPPAATSWMLIGIALVLAARVPRRSKARILVPAIALSTLSIASLSLVGYLYGASRLYSIPTLTVIALQTATFIAAVSLGLAAIVPQHGVVRLMSEGSAAGVLVRRAAFAIIFVAITLGFIRVRGEQAGLYDSAFGTAMRTIIEIALLLGLLWWTARAVSRQNQRVREHEQLLRSVTENARVGLVIVSPDHRYLYANRAYAEVLGLPAYGIVGRRVGDVLPSVYESEVRPRLDRAFHGQHVQYELALPDRDRSVAVTYQPQAENGVISSVIVAVVDISERKRAEETLRRAVEFDEAVMNNMGEGLYTVDKSGLVTSMNAAAERLFGWTLDELRGRRMHDVTHYKHRDGTPFPAEECAGLQVLREGAVLTEHEDCFIRKDGTFFDVVFSAAPIRERGEITGLVVVFRDISERKRLELERGQLLESERAARAEAERQSVLKDEFLATLSHELRTPLNAILGWSQMLRPGQSSQEDLSEGLEVIARNARIQTQLIEDLLDMSRIISGKVRLDVQRVDLPSIIEAAIESLRPAAEAKSIRLRRVLDPHAGPVTGDPSRLQQVLWNLLSNAIKFTPRDGRVQIFLERVNSHVEITVTDTGQGIRPEFLPHVFERFRQADSSTTRRHGGLGLGLSIVRHLVELHGGGVRARSPGPGKGSTFVVTLPLTIIHPEEPSPVRRHPSASPENAPCGDLPRLENVKVLFVDDEPDARALVKRLLEECGAAVTSASSASEALRVLSTVRPDVLISDIGMPERDGYELLRAVRGLPDPQLSQTPAIALTAFARSDDRLMALQAGYQMHISKPVEPAELIASVASLAGRITLGQAPVRGI
jgi:PAS domain S-box-containing protein